ncbi:MAG: hypothetical protein D6730_00445, partial [Bacteroidetes bacterium]
MFFSYLFSSHAARGRKFMLLCAMLFGFCFAQSQLECNSDVQAAISVAGEVDQFTFMGEAGVPVVIRAYSFPLDVKLELKSPEGTVLQGAVPVNNLSRIDFVPTESGQYVLLVMDEGGNNTGDYSLSLQFVQATCTEASLGCDANFDSQFGIRTELDAYTLKLEAGVPAILRAYSFPPDVALELYSPAGVFIQRTTP